jgi:hypothetical protein
MAEWDAREAACTDGECQRDSAGRQGARFVD